MLIISYDALSNRGRGDRGAALGIGVAKWRRETVESTLEHGTAFVVK